MRRIADAMPGAVAELVRAAPLSPGKVTFAWTMAVGAALERATAVALEGSTIAVTVETRQWAREVHRSSQVILKRLERYLGPGVVTKLDVRIGLLPSGTQRPAPGTSTRNPGSGTQNRG